MEKRLTMSRNSEDIHNLASRVLDLARRRGVTIGCAESCTGGLIAAALTAVPGSSDVFVGGVVSYWVDVKEQVLGVKPEIIEEYGVVSEECARAMAKGACETLSCDYAVSTTGIAGPGGAEPGKPVGTVCFSIMSNTGHVNISFTTCEGSSRDEVRDLAVCSALQELYEALDAKE